MRRMIAILGLGMMVVGLLFTAFGTRQVYVYSSKPPVCTAAGSIYSGIEVCVTELAPLRPDFTINYLGGCLAILGAAGFGAVYPFERFKPGCEAINRLFAPP